LEIKIKDAFSAAILGIEEAIWELQDLEDNHCEDFSELELSDLVSAKELSQSARDMLTDIMRRYTIRKRKK
jgi:hypothetical protein